MRRAERQQRKESLARAQAGIVSLPLTPETLEAMWRAREQAGRDTGFNEARDGVRSAVRSWFVAGPTEDPRVLALLDDLDPGWRAACGVEAGKRHAVVESPTEQGNPDTAAIADAWAQSGAVQQLVDEDGGLWVSAADVERLLDSLSGSWRATQEPVTDPDGRCPRCGGDLAVGRHGAGICDADDGRHEAESPTEQGNHDEDTPLDDRIRNGG